MSTPSHTVPRGWKYTSSLVQAIKLGVSPQPYYASGLAELCEALRKNSSTTLPAAQSWILRAESYISVRSGTPLCKLNNTFQLQKAVSVSVSVETWSHLSKLLASYIFALFGLRLLASSNIQSSWMLNDFYGVWFVVRWRWYQYCSFTGVRSDYQGITMVNYTYRGCTVSPKKKYGLIKHNQGIQKTYSARLHDHLLGPRHISWLWWAGRLVRFLKGELYYVRFACVTSSSPIASYISITISD